MRSDGTSRKTTTGPRHLFWRLVAASVDGGLAFLLTLALLLLLGIRPADLSDPGQARPLLLAAALDGAVLILGSAAFLTWTEGRTPGKAMAGLRVAGLTGFRAALEREALRWLPYFVGFGTLVASDSLQTHGDAIAAAAIFVAVLILPWYYILPFFALEGDCRARWDKIAGSWVERIAD